MSQAADQNTPIRDLGALLRYLTVELGYTKGVAVFMMNERYLDGQLELTKVEYVGVKPQGEVPIDSEFGHIELDRRGVRFVSRIKLWRKVIYRIAEGCDVRGIWPRRLPAAQTAPDQQPDPDPLNGDHPSAAQSSRDKSKREGPQVRRVRQALKETFPPHGHPPVDMTQKAILKRVNEFFEPLGGKPAKRDTLARAMGRRRA